MKAYNYEKQNMHKNYCNLKVGMSKCSAGEVVRVREGTAFPVRPKILIYFRYIFSFGLIFKPWALEIQQKAVK